jgi:phosphoribosylformimino-5-aminoimidazole carboxamide ribotide isomerase
MTTFTLYPAIDLRQGQVVRLAHGELTQQTVYDNDPAAVAQRWQAAGANWIHVVNLDGAFGEEGQVNAQALRAILKAADMWVQFGGGLRTIEAIRSVLKLGVARVVIGTAAVENPTLVDQALSDFGSQRIAVGIDAREGWVKLRGWVEDAAVTALDLARRLKAQGVETVVFTDIARDGVGAGVNVESTATLAQDSQLSVIASGGVNELEDVERVRAAGLPGLIIGRALYEGRFGLADALRVSQSA